MNCLSSLARPAILVLFAFGLPMAAAAQLPVDHVYSRTDSVLAMAVDNGEVRYAALDEQPSLLERLVGQIQKQNIDELSRSHQKAFLLNAYNLLVIHAVVQAYPIGSPQEVPQFFTKRRYRVAGKKRSLDQIEALLFDRFPDPRLHFALVCAARSCPPLPDSAYTGPTLDDQLDAITKQTLASAQFVTVDSDSQSVTLSKIIEWYRDDFTRDASSLLEYVNQYRSHPLPTSASVSFHSYDWTLNDASQGDASSTASGAADLQRFTPSTLIRPGQFTVKLFNNLYTQTAYFDGSGTRTELNQRSTFYTGIINSYVGLSSTVNAGFELYVRSVRIDRRRSSPFSALSFSDRAQSRTRVTSLLPKVKWAPQALNGVVLQLGVLLPFATDVDGRDGGPFLAHGDPQLQLRSFYDTPLGDQFLLYLESGVLGRLDEQSQTEWSVPLRSIVNYYPTDRVTLYGLVSTTPAFHPDQGTVSSQIGAGAKVELIPGIQVEVLTSTFPLGVNAGAGVTYNFGLRILR